MLQWKKWVCQAFSALLKGLRGEDPVGMASLNIFAFLMLAFQYEESDSASMGGGAVKLGSYQILCVPCWVTVKWLQSLEEFSLHRKPGTEMHTGLGFVDSCEFNYCTSKYFDDVFPKNPVFLKGYTKNGSTGFCCTCLFLSGKGKTWDFFLIILVQMKCLLLTVMLKCFLWHDFQFFVMKEQMKRLQIQHLLSSDWF